MSSRDLLVAVDIGGTFTDITLQDAATGEAWTAKTPSTPADPSEAFLTGVGLALSAAGRQASEVGRVLHGTTVATNLILEGKTAPTALLTTQGFRHVLEIGRADLPRRDNLWAWQKPRRPVPPAQVHEIPGRIAADGSELMPLDEAAVREAARARWRPARGPSPSASCTASPIRRMSGARWLWCVTPHRGSPSPLRPMCCRWCGSTSAAWRRY